MLARPLGPLHPRAPRRPQCMRDAAGPLSPPHGQISVKGSVWVRETQRWFTSRVLNRPFCNDLTQTSSSRMAESTALSAAEWTWPSHSATASCAALGHRRWAAHGLGAWGDPLRAVHRADTEGAPGVQTADTASSAGVGHGARRRRFTSRLRESAPLQRAHLPRAGWASGRRFSGEKGWKTGLELQSS